MGATFLLFGLLGTSPAYHCFSNVRDSGLATSYSGSLRTCRCTSPSPMDLCSFQFLWWSSSWSSPAAGSSSFSQSQPFGQFLCIPPRLPVLCRLPFQSWICPRAPCASMQASQRFCPTSSLFGCIAPELWGGDPRILTSFLRHLFPPGLYPMILDQAGPFSMQYFIPGSWIVHLHRITTYYYELLVTHLYI